MENISREVGIQAKLGLERRIVGKLLRSLINQPGDNVAASQAVGRLNALHSRISQYLRDSRARTRRSSLLLSVMRATPGVNNGSNNNGNNNNNNGNNNGNNNNNSSTSNNANNDSSYTESFNNNSRVITNIFSFVFIMLGIIIITFSFLFILFKFFSFGYIEALIAVI
jgi:type II secretory pathway pseudopilin PulG